MSKKNRRNQTKSAGVFPFPENANPNTLKSVPVFDSASMAKTIDGFENFASRVGMMQDTGFAAGHYSLTQLTKNRLQLEAAYRGSWVVGAVIDCKAEDMTRSGIHLTSNEAADKLNDMHTLMSRLSIMQSIAFGIKWGNLYGGAIAVIQIEGQAPDSALNPDSIGKDQFQGLTVYDRWQLQPSLTETIQSGPYMGLPAYYTIVTGIRSPSEVTQQNMQMNSPGAIRFHHSRCIRFTGIDLPYHQAMTENLWGESILERLWDRLIAFDNATMSSASLIDRANLRTIGVEGLREILAQGGKAQQGLESMFDMMRMLQNNNGLTLIDKNDEFMTTAYSFAGLSDMMLQFGQQLSGATGIPMVRLFGQSPAGLSATGESDLRMYYDNINAQQESKLRNPFEVLVKILFRSLYGTDAPKDLGFTFTPLWQMSATEKANIAKTNAETITGVHSAGLIKNSTALKELREDSGDTGLFGNITDEEINEADEMTEAPPMPEMANPEPEAPTSPAKLSLVANDSATVPMTPFQKIKSWLSSH